MADISIYLQKIMSAVYGEDVRGSIHDAIEIINEVGEVVLTTGTAVTSGSSSSTGFFEDSLYLNTDTFELWKCIGTDTWQSQGILKGDTGDPGEDGNRWFRGTGISGKAVNPTVYSGSGITDANPNDFYLNPSEGAVYHCVTGGDALTATWSYDFTMAGGGGSSYAAGNGIDIDINDVISIDPGSISNGETKPVTGGAVYNALLNKLDGKKFGTEISSDGTTVSFTGIDPAKGYLLIANYPNNYNGAPVTMDNFEITNDGANPPTYSVIYSVVNASVNQSFDLYEL